MEKEKMEGDQVIWSGELDSGHMIIDLGLNDEELTSLHLPFEGIPIFHAADHTQDELNNEDEKMINNRPEGDKEDEAKGYDEDISHDRSIQSGDENDSDFIPDEENQSSEGDEEDDECEVVCSEDEQGKKNSEHKIFKSNQRRKHSFNLSNIYEFAEEEEGDDKDQQLDDTEDEDSNLTTERTKNKNGRRWDKLSACKFCSWVGTGKLKLHLVAKHKKEEEVKKIMDLEKDPSIKLKTKEQRLADKPRFKKMKELLNKIRNDGMQRHNMNLIVNGKTHKDPKKNTLLVKRREESARSLNDILHCTICNVSISRHQLSTHMDKAHKIKPGRNCQSKAKACEPIAKTIAKDFQDKVMDSLNVGPERLQIRQDKLIITKGEKLFASQNSEDHPRHLETCRNRMRELARLVIKARKFEPKIKVLEQLMVPKNYDLIVVATKELCSFNEKKKTFDKATLAKGLGHSINSCIGILRGQYIRQEDEAKLRTLGYFENLMKEWKDDISRHALRSIYMKRQSKPLSFPLAKDVHNFALFLKNRITEATQNLEEEVTVDSFKLLCEAAFIQITMFNRKRSGEVERLLLDTYLNRLPNETHEDIVASLSKLEKALLNQLVLVKTPGKCGTIVPILLTSSMRMTLDLICKARSELPEMDDNQFVFPAATKLKHINGPSVFRKLSKEADLVKPEFVRSRNLRTHVGTMSQISNLGKSGLRVLSKLMGHTEAVHAQFYEMPEDTLLVSKASKVLFAMEKGIMKYKGLSLDEIQISLDDEPEEDDLKEGEEDTLDKEAVDEKEEEPKQRKVTSKENPEKLSNDDQSDSEPTKKIRQARPERNLKRKQEPTPPSHDEDYDSEPTTRKQKGKEMKQVKTRQARPERNLKRKQEPTPPSDDEDYDSEPTTRKQKGKEMKQVPIPPSDDEDYDSESEPTTRKQKGKEMKQVHTSWDEHKSDLESYFIEELSSVGPYAGNMKPNWPRQEKCLAYIKKYGIQNRTWKQVKDCVANKMKKIMTSGAATRKNNTKKKVTGNISKKIVKKHN